MTRAGFVSLIGPPNAGKSTLMNTLVGQKVSIVTPKVQTTRSRIRGIAMHGDAQVVFVDTPGIFVPKRRLDRAMVNAAWQGADDSDLVVLVHDVARSRIDDDTARILESLAKNQISAVLVLNKIDLVSRERLLERADELSQRADFSRVFMLSAEKGKGTDDFLAWLAQQMPEGPYLFDPDDLSDMPMRLLAAEILREKLFLNLHEELPYQLTVETESWEEREDGSAEVRCSIFVAREGHRGIVLGKGGKTIGRIGSAARRELEEVLDRRVHLFTHVKFRKDWMNDPARYQDWDLDFNA
ncbi:MAG: GTPase Era [Alphaproteobacteria bacterium]|jgi:GTP-binding protein Era|nr:GTPase Era [Alphaproteobacteria bacterium]